MSPSNNHLEVTVVVSGQSQTIRINVHQKLEHLVREALHASGNAGQAPSEWELRTEQGMLLDQDARASDAGIVSGVTLFLNPQTGVGGQQ